MIHRGVLLLGFLLMGSLGHAEVVITDTAIKKASKIRKVFSLDRQVPPGWAALDFDDSAWKPTLEAKAKGGLYRYHFDVGKVDAVERVLIELSFRDGVLVYLNGVEWFRANMPPGFIAERTPATTIRDSEEASTYESWDLEPSFLEEGENVLAISVHSGGEGMEGDLGLDLGLKLERAIGSRIKKKQERAGRTVSWERKESLDSAISADWKVTAFDLEEIARDAYDEKNWKAAAAAYTRSLLAYKYAHRGMALLPELKFYLLSNPTLAREFLELLSPYDHESRVYGVLNELFTSDQSRFRAFPRLAMAIGLVYDQAPPRHWPHGQVSRNALPRRLPEPLEAMAFFVQAERSGETLFPLERLMIEELKYVVDIVAPFEELRWAHKELPLERMSVVKLYGSVAYDAERMSQRKMSWLDDEDYRLQTILARGGICSDQAYYMTQIAKAHAVPCITVIGMVENGLHAWVGFMEEPGKWSFLAGRSAESKYVTGRAFDPQTWRRPMEYELAFLKERLAFEPSYRLSMLHSSFAMMALREGDEARAVSAASEALKQDKRNLNAWTLLIQQTRDPLTVETLCRNAAKAFRSYPDLEAGYLRRLASLLSQRGEESEAERVRSEIVRRNREERPDLAMAEAARGLAKAMNEQTIDEQVQLYKRELSHFRDAGMLVVDQMVEPFVRHLSRQGERDLALKAIAYARQRLVVSQPEPLDRALAALEAKVSSR